METQRRTLAKAATWQLSGLAVMTAITFVVTGSWGQGGVVALTGAAVGSVTYVLHERAWARVRWGRRG